MQNLLNDLTKLLDDHGGFTDENGNLLKNRVVEYALKLDGDLLRLLLKSKSIKKHFFTEVDGILVFDKRKFQSFVSNKEFLPDSYTAFKNKIGLADEKGDFISSSGNVTLVWPYKDCVLEGGQTKEDQKRDEIFWNETLAPDEIYRLFAPKVITNWKRIDGKGEHILSGNEKIDFDRENFIIKGNNLLTLHSIYKRFAGKVKLIYIDPPYNPPSQANTFAYNNSFNRSTWLTFMKNRLEIAKRFLQKDGVLVVAIDKNEQPRLQILIEESFPDSDVDCITIIHNPRGAIGVNFSYTHEYAIFVTPKGKKSISNRKLKQDEIEWSPLRNWGGESLRTDAKNCFYPIIIEDNKILGFGNVCADNYHPKQTEKHGKKYYVYPIDSNGVERKWRYARQTVESVLDVLRVKTTNTGFDIEIGKNFGTYKTVWVDSKYDASTNGTQLLKSILPNTKFTYPKSLYNVMDCIAAVVEEDKEALVLDFFAGSGTTAHAVMEINKDGGNRRFILIEQMNYIEKDTLARTVEIMKSIASSSSVIYCELFEWNEAWMTKIQEAKTTAELKAIWVKMSKNAYLNYYIDVKAVNDNVSVFEELSLEEQKRFLIETLDKNCLYVDYSEIKDKDYNVSETDKKLNALFYSEE
jgi:adenine-specific DNA-methyltransferase